MGQDNDVRVFDVQHIKGLEFEAVFFIAIDRLAALQPELFDKYLYVGTTRADTYLGVTCEDALPPVSETLQPMFTPHMCPLKPAARSSPGQLGLDVQGAI